MSELHAHSAPGRRPDAAPDPAPISASRRLLVMMPSWVGDCVMATPVLRAIRRQCALSGHETFIAAYLRPHLVPLFASGNLLDECIGGRPRGLLGPAREAGRLHPWRFDTALLLPNSFRTAWTARLARIPRRIGFDRDRRGWLLSDRVPCPMPGGWHEPMPLIDYYLRLAAPFGIEAPHDTSPRLTPASAELGRARALLGSRKFAHAGAHVALLNPGASKAGKRWPADRFASLADHLHDICGMGIVINGAPDERELTADVAGRIRRANVLDLAREETTLATLAALCSLVDLIVTNDTGTRHIAAAVGFEQLRRGETAPGIVTIFGTVRPEWTTLNYPREIELFDRGSGRIDAIGIEQVTEGCRRVISNAR
jgi:heptosyltransferase II